MKLSKLYGQMTAREKAELVFQLMATRDEVEINKIAETIPRKTYTMPDLEYKDRLELFFNMGLIWAFEYQQCLTKIFSVLFHNNTAKNEKLDISIHIRKERCLHIALARLEKFGLRREGVYSLAEITPEYRYSDDDLADELDRKMTDQIEEKYAEILA